MVPSLMPQEEEEASQTDGAVPSTPSPVLFSSEDQAVPLGEEECEEEIGCQGQGGAGGEGAKNKLSGFAAEEPWGWMNSTMASLGDEGDKCIMVGQLCSPTAFTVQIEMQGTPLEAMVDTGAEVTVPGTEVYDRLQEKPPVRRRVTMLQAGDGAHLKGFIAGPLLSRRGRTFIRWTCT